MHGPSDTVKVNNCILARVRPDWHAHSQSQRTNTWLGKRYSVFCDENVARNWMIALLPRQYAMCTSGTF